MHVPRKTLIHDVGFRRMIELSQSPNPKVTGHEQVESRDRVLLTLLLKLGLITAAILLATALLVGGIVALGLWQVFSSGTLLD